ncbi:unnamed protein product, partial [Meganyctiphanes norvegica]
MLNNTATSSIHIELRQCGLFAQQNQILSMTTKMSATGDAAHVCETLGCNSEAKLQCPTCIKLAIQGSFFCSQECFKGSWDTHKILHKKSRSSTAGNTEYNPWPYYTFTGSPSTPSTTMSEEAPKLAEHPPYAE